ncbi:hypothetical protein E4T42_04782 [Aureobasidium subglaciale]|nr:hypothetical protein E4T42_04782 [Aureobasidium subglaciale]
MCTAHHESVPEPEPCFDAITSAEHVLREASTTLTPDATSSHTTHQDCVVGWSESRSLFPGNTPALAGGDESDGRGEQTESAADRPIERQLKVPIVICIARPPEVSTSDYEPRERSRQQSRAGSRRRLNGYESNIVDAYDDRSLDPSSNESLIDEAKRLANEYHALFNEDTKFHSNRKHTVFDTGVDRRKKALYKREYTYLTTFPSFSAFYQRINADAEQLAREHNKPGSKVTFELNTLPIFGHHVRKLSITAIEGLSSVIENIKQRRPSFPIIGAPQPISAAEAYNPVRVQSTSTGLTVAKKRPSVFAGIKDHRRESKANKRREDLKRRIKMVPTGGTRSGRVPQLFDRSTCLSDARVGDYRRNRTVRWTWPSEVVTAEGECCETIATVSPQAAPGLPPAVPWVPDQQIPPIRGAV